MRGGCREQRHHRAEVRRGGPADLDAALDHVRSTLQPPGQSIVVDVDHRGRDPAAGVRGGDSGSHQTGSEHSDPFDVARLDTGGSPGVLADPGLHEEDSNHVAGDLAADDLASTLALDFQTLVQGPVESLLHGFECRHRSGILALGLEHHLSGGDGEAEGDLVVTESHRGPSPFPDCQEAIVLGEPFDQATSLVDQIFGIDCVEDQPQFGRPFCGHRSPAADDIDGVVQSDQPRQSL